MFKANIDATRQKMDILSISCSGELIKSVDREIKVKVKYG